MKNILIITILIYLLSNKINAQNINWRAFDPAQKYIVGLNAGLDFGLTYGINYGRKLNTKLPLVLNSEISLPSGNKVLEDFKVKMGVQMEVIHAGNFSATLKVNGILDAMKMTIPEC